MGREQTTTFFSAAMRAAQVRIDDDFELISLLKFQFWCHAEEVELAGYSKYDDYSID
jgi:hypothetical protein